MYQVSGIGYRVSGIKLSKVKFLGIDEIKYFELFKLRFNIYPDEKSGFRFSYFLNWKLNKIHIDFAFIFGLDFSSVCAGKFVFN